MQTFGTALQAFAVQHLVNLAGGRPRAALARLSPCLGKGLRIAAAALEAGPMPRRKRSRLVKKKQLGVEAAPDIALAALEVEHAADPLPRCPAPRRQRLRIGVKSPAAVAHEQPARRRGKQLSERSDSILQRHCLRCYFSTKSSHFWIWSFAPQGMIGTDEVEFFGEPSMRRSV